MLVNWPYAREVGLCRFFARTAARQFVKRVLRRDLTVSLPTGLRLDLPRENQAASEVYVKSCRLDWGSDALLARHLGRGGWFIDVGANIGYYSLYMAPLVRRVIAVEPDRRNWPALERNAARATNVTVVRAAASARAGTGFLWTGGNSAIGHLAADGQPTDITTVDLLAAGDTVTGIKIDVEGHDFDVLRGAEATLRRDHPLVLTEFTASEGNRPAALFALIDRLGYRAYGYVDATGRHFMRLAPDTVRRAAMVFLVPPRLQPEFDRLCATAGGHVFSLASRAGRDWP